MRRVAHLILIIAAALSPGQGGAQQTSTASLDTAQRQALFNDVWTTINEDYYNPSLKGVDWRAVRERYRAPIASAVTDSAFYVTLRRMLQELHDLHTTFVVPSAPGLTSGVGVRFVEGRVVIVRADSVALAAGARIGMIVRAVADEDTDTRLARIRETLIKSSSQRADDLLVGTAFLVNRQDVALSIDVEVVGGHRDRFLLSWHPPAETPTMEWRRLPSGFGYVRFVALRHPADADFARAMGGLGTLPGIVVDLRGNVGGDMKGVGGDIASRLVSSKTTFGHFVDREGKTPWFRSLEVGPQDGGFAGPLVILIDGATRSAAEVFANGFQEAGRALLVGSRTCGCVFDIKSKDEPGGGKLRYSHLAFRSKSGRVLEGEGVVPDVASTPTIRGLLDGRDEVLKAAEGVLASLVAPPERI